MKITDGTAQRVIGEGVYRTEREDCLQPKELILGRGYIARFITNPRVPRVYASEFQIVVDDLEERELPVVTPRVIPPYFRLSMLEVFPAGHMAADAETRPMDEHGVLYNRFLTIPLLGHEIGYLPRAVNEAALILDSFHGTASVA